MALDEAGPPDAVAADVRDRTGQLLERLRVYGAAYAELTRRWVAADPAPPPLISRQEGRRSARRVTRA